LSSDLFREFDEPSHCWINDPSEEDGLPPTTTAGEALADLPPIYALNLLKGGLIARGRKDPAEPVGCTSTKPTTAWSKLMRQWPSFGTDEQTTGHVIRYLPRDKCAYSITSTSLARSRIELARARVTAAARNRGIDDPARQPKFFGKT
jgi:hypothetical protein